MSEFVIEQPGVPLQTLIFTGMEMSFGRAADNDVVLVAEEVSRHHAKLVRRDRKLVIEDLKSLNGTFVNRQRVVERVLADQDEIWLGGKCKIYYHSNADSPAEEPEEHSPGSTLRDDLARIRSKMDEVGGHLTMLGTRGPGAGAPPVIETSTEDLLDMSRAYRRLEALYRTSRLIASEFDLSKRLASVLDTVMEVLDAERGFVLLREGDNEALRVSVARGMGRELLKGAPSMGIAQRATRSGEPMLVGNTQSSAEFGLRESIVNQSIVSAMCVPMQIEDRILGSIYVDTSKPGFAFDEADLELFSSLAMQSAMAVDNVRLYERMLAVERKRANLGRFLSPSIVDKIMNEESTLMLGGGKNLVTTLFCDIRGFTPMTEQMAADRLVELLNEHFTAMTQIVFDHNGTLDKYIGDEIMAVFGAPLTAEDDAEQAVRAALAIQARNRELNEERRRQGRQEIQIGIGIDTGEVLAGYMGSPMRMEFTVVGDHVNTARRLCDLAAGGQVVIGAATFACVQDLVRVRSIGSMILEGKQNPVDAYEVLG